MTLFDADGRRLDDPTTTTTTRGGYEIEVTPDLYGFFIWKDGDCVAYIHPDEAVREMDARLKALTDGRPPLIDHDEGVVA
tara:strand:+ start:140 stop:379 length:240 start_codon:yes stop_codon:yes gene_type:complete